MEKEKTRGRRVRVGRKKKRKKGRERMGEPAVWVFWEGKVVKKKMN